MRLVLVLSSPSGGGKTTLARMLSEGLGLVHVVTVTTRPRRSHEREGVDYVFLSREEFEDWIRRGELFEWAEIYGNFYGVPKDSLFGPLKAGRDVVLTLDVNGKRALETYFRGKEGYTFLSVFIKPPSPEELLRRLKKRGDVNPEERISKLKEELLLAHEYDYMVVNEDLKVCYEILSFIVQKYRS